MANADDACLGCSACLHVLFSLLYLALAGWSLAIQIREAVPVPADIVLFVGLLGIGCLLGCSSLGCCTILSNRGQSSGGGCMDAMGGDMSFVYHVLCFPVYLVFLVIAVVGSVWIAVDSGVTLFSILVAAALIGCLVCQGIQAATHCSETCMSGLDKLCKREQRQVAATVMPPVNAGVEVLSATINSCAESDSLNVDCTTLGGTQMLNCCFPKDARVADLESALRQKMGWQWMAFLVAQRDVPTTELLNEHKCGLTVKRQLWPARPLSPQEFESTNLPSVAPTILEGVAIHGKCISSSTLDALPV